MYIRKIKNKVVYNDNLLSIKVDRGNIKFLPGQHFSISIKDKFINREYSAFSSENNDEIEFLIKIVEGGVVSNQLKEINNGDEIFLHGPFGKFLNFDHNKYKKMIFISTGSGIAPYRSYILSNNISNFRLIHGVRTTDDIVETETFSKGDVEYCISRENNHNYFKGRVTDYLNEVDNDLFSKDNMFFICGNKDMIADVYDLLINKYNISSSNIDSETFF